MSIQYWLVPSPKRNKTHIKDYGPDKEYYYCGTYCTRSLDKLQGAMKKPDMVLCKNCIRVFNARKRGVKR